MISYPAPAFKQYADEDLVIQLGAVIFPDSLRRWPGENGFRIWVEGAPNDPKSRAKAAAIFMTVLGVLRTWRSAAGELREEGLSGLGEGSARGEDGGQWLQLGTAYEYRIAEGEIDVLAENARRGIDQSQHFRNALWLHGRTNRTAADYYMIHEYAVLEFDGTKGVRDALGITVASQERLTASANHLSPLAGGRHAARIHEPAQMTLEEQRMFVATLLRCWIANYEK